MAAQTVYPRPFADDAEGRNGVRPSRTAVTTQVVLALVVAAHLVLIHFVTEGIAVRPPVAAIPEPISVRWIAAPAPKPMPRRTAATEPVRTPKVVPAPAAPSVHRHAPRPAVLAAAMAPRPTAEPPAEPPADRPAPDVAAATASETPITPPRVAAYLSNPAPAYPAAARDARQEGRVSLRVLVGADGRPQQTTVARSSGFPLLDEAAVAAVRGWRFAPAERAGISVDAWVLIPITFKLGT